MANDSHPPKAGAAPPDIDRRVAAVADDVDGPPRYVAVAGEHGGTPVDPTAANRAPGEQIPVEAGRRGYVDERTGEVHGSGSGAGGGNPAEDYDADSPGGGGEVRATQVPTRGR